MSDRNASAQNGLVSKIRERMASTAEGRISFRDYMELCLYDPEDGYYTGTRTKIGKSGDFYTSAGIGGLMGELIADYAVRACPADEPLDTVEWGAGNGAMALQFLDFLRTAIPERYREAAYTIVERSPHHRLLQQEALREHAQVVRILSPEQWTSEHAAADRFRFVFSNELLDSFPVERVRLRGNQLMEVMVGWEEERLVETEVPCERDELRRYVQDIKLRDGQTADLNLAAPRWIGERLGELRRGLLLTIDYGDRAEELYGPHRMNGTLMTYRRHIAGTDPYDCPGEQDLTAHVDFTACWRAGERHGVRRQSLKTQREFLVEAGILNRLQDHLSTDPFSPAARRNRAIRQLLLSDGMSELFKVLEQQKG